MGRGPRSPRRKAKRHRTKLDPGHDAGTPYSQRKDNTVKSDIHPQMTKVTAVCACGNTFETYSTKDELRLEICNECHPFFTGRQKLIDSAGRVERFKRRYQNQREA